MGAFDVMRHIVFDSLTTSYQHQAEELWYHGLVEARAWLWQMRSGKTKVGIDNAAGLWQWALCDGAIIIAPAGVHREWTEREVWKHACVPVSPFTWDAAKSRTKKAARARREFVNQGRGAMLFASFNKEALRTKLSWEMLVELATTRRMMLIVDECHHFRNPKAKITQRLHKLARLCTYRRILTGTPVANCPLGLWSQFEVLSPGALGYADYEAFCDQYSNSYRVKMDPAKPGGRPRVFPVITGYTNLPELRSSLALWSSVITRDDCADLPDLVRSRRYIELPPKLWKLYKQLRDEFLVFLDDHAEVSAAEGGARLTKLMQVLSGWVYDDNKRVHELLAPEECPRLEAVGHVLEECPGKVVVWCRHRYDVYRVASFINTYHRPGMALQYYGDVSQADRHTIRSLMLEDPRPFVFVGTPNTGAEGLNLSKADSIVWATHTHNVVHRDQADERASLPGKSTVAVTDVCVPGTAEEKALDLLDQRRNLGDELGGRGLKAVLRAMLTRSEPLPASPWAQAA